MKNDTKWKCVKVNTIDYYSPYNTPSFGNHLFANYHVFKHPRTNLILSSLYIPKVLKSAAKIMEIGSQTKI